MSWTNAWDETKPADSDLANTLGTQGRLHKLDERERLNYQHVFGQSQTDDGNHRFVNIPAAYHPVNTESFKAAGHSLTVANAQSCIDLASTWNTSGRPSGIKLDVVDTASDVLSRFLNFLIGGVSKFGVGKNGGLKINNGVNAPMGTTSVATSGGGGATIVNTTAVHTNSLIFLSFASGLFFGPTAWYTNIVDSTSFRIEVGANGADGPVTFNVNWLIIDPA